MLRYALFSYAPPGRQCSLCVQPKLSALSIINWKISDHALYDYIRTWCDTIISPQNSKNSMQISCVKQLSSNTRFRVCSMRDDRSTTRCRWPSRRSGAMRRLVEKQSYSHPSLDSGLRCDGQTPLWKYCFNASRLRGQADIILGPKWRSFFVGVNVAPISGLKRHSDARPTRTIGWAKAGFYYDTFFSVKNRWKVIWFDVSFSRIFHEICVTLDSGNLFI